ncbi:MAG: potH [Verrucomicrobiaceae bacterium]|nr:potH [Verrucomicrobiaceae bacterium]
MPPPASPAPPQRKSVAEALFTAPSFAWMLALFAWPAAHLFLMAFHPADVTGGVGEGWTTSAWKVFGEEGYLETIWRTLWVSAHTTAGCVLLALPVAWRISRASRQWRSWLLLLVVLPFWTSFLIRVYSWRVLLQDNGLLATWFKSRGLMGEDSMLLYNPTVVVIVMIYTYLPMAVLPIYAAMEKFDPALLDAAHDLGATRLQSFFKVVLPSIKSGLVAAALLVGIPSLGSYVVPEMVGGIDAEMLGSKIGQRLFSDRNLPQAAALATALALLAMPAVFLAVRRKSEESA